MKKVLMLAVAACLIVPTVAHATWYPCFEKQRIKWVSVGNVEGAVGTDNGNAVYFATTQQEGYALHRDFNLDTDKGRALYDLLMRAIDDGNDVHAYSRVGGSAGCTNIDQLILEAKW